MIRTHDVQTRNVRLHSREPEREARKFLESRALPDDLDYIILLECGLGYLIPPLRERFPQAKIINIHLSREFCAATVSKNGGLADVEWSPECGGSCTALLEREICDTEAARIKIIEWRPAIALNPRLFSSLLAEITSFVRRSDANARTVRYFSERWRRNCQRNILYFAQNIDLFNNNRRTSSLIHKTIAVCAAGPSINTKIIELRKLRKNGTTILAVSSAVLSLAAHDLLPDIVFASDGGGWARLHFFALFRAANTGAAEAAGNKKPLVAATLNAALPTQLATFPLLLIGDGSKEQAKMLHEAGLPQLALPQRGTVTVSAIDFAKAISGREPLVFGADFACKDIQSHVKPYAFDALLENTATRLNPFYHQKWVRTRAIILGGSLKIFAGWQRAG